MSNRGVKIFALPGCIAQPNFCIYQRAGVLSLFVGCLQSPKQQCSATRIVVL